MKQDFLTFPAQITKLTATDAGLLVSMEEDVRWITRTYFRIKWFVQLRILPLLGYKTVFYSCRFTACMGPGATVVVRKINKEGSNG